LFYLSHVPLIGEISAYGDVVAHQKRFAQGVLDTRPIAFYGSSALLMLVFTVRSLEARRW
jgi:hypothetical protein